MPPRNPLAIQLDFPLLVADIISELNLTGTIGLLNFSPEVVPVYLAAARDGLVLSTTPAPTFASAGIADGKATNPAANTVIATTGALPAGTYDIVLSLSAMTGTGNIVRLEIEHRNAANTITLATLAGIFIGGTNASSQLALPIFGYEIGVNHSLRIINDAVFVGQMGGTIYTQIRAVP